MSEQHGDEALSRDDPDWIDVPGAWRALVLGIDGEVEKALARAILNQLGIRPYRVVCRECEALRLRVAELERRLEEL